jgi:hypothetical protein
VLWIELVLKVLITCTITIHSNTSIQKTTFRKEIFSMNTILDYVTNSCYDMPIRQCFIRQRPLSLIIQSPLIYCCKGFARLWSPWPTQVAKLCKTELFHNKAVELNIHHPSWRPDTGFFLKKTISHSQPLLVGCDCFFEKEPYKIVVFDSIYLQSIPITQRDVSYKAW